MPAGGQVFIVVQRTFGWLETRHLSVTVLQPDNLMVLFVTRPSYFLVCIVVPVTDRVITTFEDNTNSAGCLDCDSVYQWDHAG